MSIKHKRRYVVSLHKSPSQTKDEFDVFFDKLWAIDWWYYCKEILCLDQNKLVDKWSFYVWRYSSRFTHYFLRLSQIISDPTHIPPNSSSCFDLFFTNQPNLVTESGAHPSLQPKRNHQILFTKLNLKVEIL